MVSHRSLLTCSFLIDIITLVPKGMTGYGNSELESSSRRHTEELHISPLYFPFSFFANLYTDTNANT